MIKIMKIIYARNVSLSRAQIRVVGLIVQYSVYVSCAEIPSRWARQSLAEQTVPSKRGISRSALRGEARPRLCQSPIYVAHFLANTFISDERRKCHSLRPFPLSRDVNTPGSRWRRRLLRLHRDIQPSPNRSRIHLHDPRPDNSRIAKLRLLDRECRYKSVYMLYRMSCNERFFICSLRNVKTIFLKIITYITLLV